MTFFNWESGSKLLALFYKDFPLCKKSFAPDLDVLRSDNEYGTDDFDFINFLECFIISYWSIFLLTELQTKLCLWSSLLAERPLLGKLILRSLALCFLPFFWSLVCYELLLEMSWWLKTGMENLFIEFVGWLGETYLIFLTKTSFDWEMILLLLLDGLFLVKKNILFFSIKFIFLTSIWVSKLHLILLLLVLAEPMRTKLKIELLFDRG